MTRGPKRAVDELVISEEEFDAFYDTDGTPLWRYVLRASGNEALAADVFQETLLRFLTSAPRNLEPGKRRSYLFRVASNLLADAWRVRRREEPLDDEANEGASAQPYRSAHEPTIAGQVDAAMDLERGFECLRPLERQILWLAHVEGFSHREVAALLGLAEGSVKVLSFRARQKVAGVLAEAAPAEKDVP